MSVLGKKHFSIGEIELTSIVSYVLGIKYQNSSANSQIL